MQDMTTTEKMQDMIQIPKIKHSSYEKQHASNSCKKKKKKKDASNDPKHAPEKTPKTKLHRKKD